MFHNTTRSLVRELVCDGLKKQGIAASPHVPSAVADLEIWIPPSRQRRLLKFYGGDGAFLRLQRRCAEDGSVILCYVWDIYETPRFFLMETPEVLRLVGPDPLQTASWMQKGYYSWSSATGLPRQRRKTMEARYERPWSWLRRVLEGKS